MNNIYYSRSYGKSYKTKVATKAEIENFKKMFGNKKCKIQVVAPKESNQKEVKARYNNLALNPNVELTITFI